MAFTDDLDLLERQIQRLHIEWDKFFGGVERKPPNDLRSKVEAMIRLYANAEIRNSGERFRYQMLTTRYNTLNELWNKRLRAMEEGKPVGVHGLKALAVEMAPITPAPHPPAADPVAPVPRSSAGEFRVQGPARNTETMRALFTRYLEERARTGESTAVKFESFEKAVSQQAERILAERGAQAVDFRLEVRDGKVSLRAKVVK